MALDFVNPICSVSMSDAGCNCFHKYNAYLFVPISVEMKSYPIFRNGSTPHTDTLLNDIGMMANPTDCCCLDLPMDGVIWHVVQISGGKCRSV